MARPLKEINWNTIEKKIEAGCTAKEIYENLCHKDTFYDGFKREFGCSFSDYSTDCYSVGDGNLKYVQYMKALSGNIAMLQLLGRERLGQGKNEITSSPLQIQLDQTHLIIQLQHELQELREQLKSYADKSKTE